MLCSAAGKEAKLALLTSTALDDQRSHRMVDVIRACLHNFSASLGCTIECKARRLEKLVCLYAKGLSVEKKHHSFHSGITRAQATAEHHSAFTSF